VRHRLVLGVVRLDLLVHQRFHLVMVVGAEGEEAQVIAQEDERMPIGVEQREALEERALVRLLHVLLERERAFGLGELEDGVEQAQELEIGALVVLLALEQAKHGAAGRFDHGEAVRGHERAQGRARDDQELEGLEQNDEMAAVQQVAAEHAHQDYG